MTEEEQAEMFYEQQRQEEEAYLSECGACPNCNQGVHVTDLGETDGKVYCINCKP